MKDDSVKVSVESLHTEDGVREVAVQMGRTVCEDLLWPVIQHTPPEMRQALFERFISAIAGAACAEIGPERTKQSLDEVKLAVDAVVAERKVATH